MLPLTAVVRRSPRPWVISSRASAQPSSGKVNSHPTIGQCGSTGVQNPSSANSAIGPIARQAKNHPAGSARSRVSARTSTQIRGTAIHGSR
jgi:hypothetical protein